MARVLIYGFGWCGQSAFALCNDLRLEVSVVDEGIKRAIEDLRLKVQNLDFVFDLNEIIKDCKESLFTNYWIHCNARGNEIVADRILETLKQKGAV